MREKVKKYDGNFDYSQPCPLFGQLLVRVQRSVYLFQWFDTTFNILDYGIFLDMEYGIFWNMEYSKIWNILKFGIFLKVDYSENGIVKETFLISHKTYVQYFGL